MNRVFGLVALLCIMVGVIGSMTTCEHPFNEPILRMEIGQQIAGERQ